MITRQRPVAGQRGFSLVEVLLAMVISVALVLPLSAWVMLALRQQPVVESDLVTTSSTGLLGIHLPNDTRMAAAAAHDENNDEVDFTDCIDGPGSDGTDVLLVLHIADVEPRKVVYKEAAFRDGGDPDPFRRSIWRRECPLNAQDQTSATEVLLDVRPGAASAECPSVGPSATCRHITFDTGLDGEEPFVLRVTRRVDAASLRFDRTGNRLPVAKIKAVSQSGDGPFTVVLSPEGSEDPDGSIVQYEWSVPVAPFVEGTPIEFEDPARLDPEDPENESAQGADQVIEWDDPGIYFVQLTVTDDQGASATTYKRVLVGRAGVVADLRVEPESGLAELTEFAFAARWNDDLTGEAVGSGGPPGRDLVYEWTIRSPLPDPFDDEGNPIQPPPAPAPDTQFTTRRTDPGVFFSSLPSSMVRSLIGPDGSVMTGPDGRELVDGTVEVELTVYDALEPDARDTVIYSVELDRPPPTVAPLEMDEPGLDDPIAVGVVERQGGGQSQNWRLDASGSQPGPAADPLVQFRWDFGPLLGSIEVAEVTPQVSNLVPGGGWYQYVLTVTDQAGRSGNYVGEYLDDRALAVPPVVSFADRRISWPEVPGASGYRLLYFFDACGATAESSIASGYRTGTMVALVPPSRCSSLGPVRIRVVAQHATAANPVDRELSTAASEVVVQTELLAGAGGGG